MCKNGQLVYSAVCNNQSAWPERLSRKTSFGQMCTEVDYEKACTDPQLKDKVCPSGLGISESLCQLYPA
jgi:hypothetical protein